MGKVEVMLRLSAVIRKRANAMETLSQYCKKVTILSKLVYLLYKRAVRFMSVVWRKADI